MFEDIEKFNFTESVNCKGPWLMYAKQLMEAAIDLESGEKDPSQFLRPRIKLMLVAFAFENLFKALFIKHGGAIASDGKLTGIRVRPAHDLVQIADCASVSLTNDEKDALRRLSHFGRFMGRYPSPNVWDEVQEIVNGETFYVVPWSSSSDDLLSNLFMRTLKDAS